MTMKERATNLFGDLVSELIFGWLLTIPTDNAIRDFFPDYDNRVGYFRWEVKSVFKDCP